MIRIAALVAYPLGMALGQVMFKLAAEQLHEFNSASLQRFVFALALNPWFLLALLLYATLSLTWVWILSGTPLSTAYPFVALAFVITPVFAFYFFGEMLTWNYAIGLALVVSGLLFILR